MRMTFLYICVGLVVLGGYAYKNYYEPRVLDDSGLLCASEVSAMSESCVDADSTGYMKVPVRGTPLRVLFYETEWLGNELQTKVYIRPAEGREWGVVSMDGELTVRFTVPGALFDARVPVRVGMGNRYHTYCGVIRQQP